MSASSRPLHAYSSTGLGLDGELTCHEDDVRYVQISTTARELPPPRINVQVSECVLPSHAGMVREGPAPARWDGGAPLARGDGPITPGDSTPTAQCSP